jgi:hypothetical protein
MIMKELYIVHYIKFSSKGSQILGYITFKLRVTEDELEFNCRKELRNDLSCHSAICMEYSVSQSRFGPGTFRTLVYLRA